MRKEYKKLSEEEIYEIIRLKGNGVSAAEIAQQMNCSERQIHRILKKNSNGELLVHQKKEVDISQKLDGCVLQEHHLAWIQEEFEVEPGISLESITERLNEEFGIHVSTSTIWRNQKNNSIQKIINQLKQAENKNAMEGMPLLIPQ
ncbi:hypothetical protein TVAG_433090 [Trichomonas vaginalis G3]|uniref:Uncharacterized protein n=1 Tax=Trichomonas vaginalis (strain ATCC PRA-98 / G3) TaxID=412133 RepID=A2DIV0_TRIV3|nr:homeodomain-like family [Trichomonas vaginalis G3]EAY19713.1 hypothetical protein TVAG_433090 [Trichomonas vaginalis G3]KAI5521267.1 homeodomain-like family [Trichomonas vaginalis G3]|eukprot:XP_001580699.1 hypothetical protein [Trichomonas vaginalis G3]